MAIGEPRNEITHVIREQLKKVQQLYMKKASELSKIIEMVLDLDHSFRIIWQINCNGCTLCYIRIRMYVLARERWTMVSHVSLSFFLRLSTLQTSCPNASIFGNYTSAGNVFNL
jgi:hypothetical protein